MQEEIAIKVDNLSKTFRLPHEKQSSIKGLLIHLLRAGKIKYEKQEVLKDVSFEINKGEFFGIVGRNGSGKSTLLKMLAGIYTPTKGHIKVNGKLTPFIELGVGFSPELTGRENVYLNGALLGFNRKQMSAMYNDIVDFAELRKFMDQKLKNYSTGMQVRLAFSIAIRVQSDVLILDEVLAVGDEAFQQKCIDVFENYKSTKQTIVLVTHDMEMVRRFCTRAVLINDGNIIKSGDPREVAAEYSKLNFENIQKNIDDNNSKFDKNLIKLKILDESNNPQTSFNTFDDMRVEISWPKDIPNIKNIGLAIHKNSGEYMFGDNTLGQQHGPSSNKVRYTVKLNLGPGKYHLVAGLFGETDKEIIDFEHDGPEFIIKTDPEDKIQGLTRLKSEWHYEQ